MSNPDILVVGGGISGASLAFHAAREGRSVVVVEKDARPGGCFATESTPEGFWYELGAHTCYNSYGAFLEVLEGCGLLDRLQARAKPVLRFLVGGDVAPGKNLGLLLRRFSKLELLRAVPRWIGASQEGETVRSYYSRLVGPRNYDRVLGPMLSAVPSQTADDFPADMLFKKRERREDVMRSFTLQGGLRTAVEGILARPGLELRAGCAVDRVARADGGFRAELEDGSTVTASVLALATPPPTAAKLLAPLSPAASAAAGRIRCAEVDSVGFAVRSSAVSVPEATFLIPVDDAFHSIVTRDVVPDPDRRGFTFHFRPGLSRDERLARCAAVLGIEAADMEAVSERHALLPSPRLGHADTVAHLDAALAAERIAVTGNWFGGLSIEDCALRSRAEWTRVSRLA